MRVKNRFDFLDFYFFYLPYSYMLVQKEQSVSEYSDDRVAQIIESSVLLFRFHKRHILIPVKIGFLMFETVKEMAIAPFFVQVGEGRDWKLVFCSVKFYKCRKGVVKT